MKSSLWVGLSERFTAVTGNEIGQLGWCTVMKVVGPWGSQYLGVLCMRPTCEGVTGSRARRASDSASSVVWGCCWPAVTSNGGLSAPGQPGVGWETAEPTGGVAVAGWWGASWGQCVLAGLELVCSVLSSCLSSSSYWRGSRCFSGAQLLPTLTLVFGFTSTAADSSPWWMLILALLLLIWSSLFFSALIIFFIKSCRCLTKLIGLSRGSSN